jgi:hypothetical protein
MASDSAPGAPGAAQLAAELTAAGPVAGPAAGVAAPPPPPAPDERPDRKSAEAPAPPARSDPKSAESGDTRAQLKQEASAGKPPPPPPAHLTRLEGIVRLCVNWPDGSHEAVVLPCGASVTDLKKVLQQESEALAAHTPGRIEGYKVTMQLDPYGSVNALSSYRFYTHLQGHHMVLSMIPREPAP